MNLDIRLLERRLRAAFALADLQPMVPPPRPNVALIADLPNPPTKRADVFRRTLDMDTRDVDIDSLVRLLSGHYTTTIWYDAHGDSAHRRYAARVTVQQLPVPVSAPSPTSMRIQMDICLSE